jgi:hypothetical protein
MVSTLEALGSMPNRRGKGSGREKKKRKNFL